MAAPANELGAAEPFQGVFRSGHGDGQRGCHHVVDDNGIFQTHIHSRKQPETAEHECGNEDAKSQCDHAGKGRAKVGAGA